MTRTSTLTLALLFISAAALFAGGCSSLPPQSGPTVGVRNDSDTPLRVCFWIGDRRQQAAGKPLEMAADRVLELAPYGTTQYKLSAFSDYESSTASFVRVQVEPVGPTFQSQTQYWYEFNPPSPFTLRVFGQKSKLQFERTGPGTMTAVPPAYWFHANPTPGATTTAGANGATPAPGTSKIITKSPSAQPLSPKYRATQPTTTTPVVTVPDSHMHE